MHENIHIQKILDPFFLEKEISLGILRIDKIHPVVSGNKIFKLSPYLEKAKSKGLSRIITFGGHFSNHLHATAYMAKAMGLKVEGWIKGKEPQKLSPTLSDCKDMGMDLKFVDHEEHTYIDIEQLAVDNPDALIIPQGGYGRMGAEGAAEILKLPGTEKYDIIVAAAGTGTMGAGLIMGASANQSILLISVLKNNFSIREEILALLTEEEQKKDFSIEHRFHFGGYAKKSQSLLDCMNRFYQKHAIPTDFVYTGKVIAGFEQILSEHRFPAGSKILLIHSGGLQGNRSLINGELCFA